MISKNRLAIPVKDFITKFMRIILTLISFYAALIAYGISASANDSENKLSMPVSDWSVSPVVNDNGFPSNKCVMRVSFDNSLELSFKGKGTKLTALRVNDVSSNKTNKIKGFVGLGIGKNSYGLQSRSKNGQIDSSLLTVVNVAKKISAKNMFRLKISGENYYFSTVGFGAAYREMMICQGQKDYETLKMVDHSSRLPRPPNNKNEETSMPSIPVEDVQVKAMVDVEGEIELVSPTQSGVNTPLSLALPMIVPSDYTFKLDEGVDPLAEISWDGDGMWQNSLQKAVSIYGYRVFVKDTHIRITTINSSRIVPVSDEATDVPTNISTKVSLPEEQKIEIVDKKSLQIWSANKGDKLSFVLKSWAKTAGVKTHIVLDNDPKLSKGINITGGFKMAVNSLLHQTSSDSGVSPNAILTNNNGRVTNVTSSNRIKNKTASSTVNRWRALEGTNLRKVLNRWCVRENVKLMWNVDQIFLIRQSVNETTGYAEAVALLLSQFNDQSVRPVAQLNTDPDTGKTSLIISLNKS